MRSPNSSDDREAWAVRPLKYLWLQAVMLVTSWLPDFTPVLKLRGFLARPAFRKCGKNLQIARHVNVGFSSRITVGKDVFMAYSTWIHGSGGITIGDGVQFGPFSVAISGNHGKLHGSYRYGRARRAPIEIGAGSWIASHSVITAGCRIGRGVLVAANTVVVKDVPDHCIVSGVPAQIVRRDVADDDPDPTEHGTKSNSGHAAPGGGSTGTVRKDIRGEESDP